MMVDICNVSKKYGNFEVIHDVSLQVEKGTINGIIGEMVQEKRHL